MMLATVVARSKNAKLGDRVAATYAHVESTCPRTCPLKLAGCYAKQNRVGMHQSRLAPPRPLPRAGIQAARVEAEGIRKLPRDGRPLRIHVSGDCRSTTAARIVSGAVADWQAVGGGPAWTYTHAWRTVPAEAWRPVSVLASYENPVDLPRAHSRGYATALVVSSFKQGREDCVKVGMKGIACPAQMRDDMTCEKCQLCQLGRTLHKLKRVILFEAHGSGARKVRNLLTQQTRGVTP